MTFHAERERLTDWTRLTWCGRRVGMKKISERPDCRICLQVLRKRAAKAVKRD